MNFKSFSWTIALISAAPAQVYSASLGVDSVECYFDCKDKNPTAEIAPAKDDAPLFMDNGPSLFGSDTQYWGDLNSEGGQSQTTAPIVSPFGSRSITPSER